MPIVRHYILEASPGSDETLYHALRNLAATVRDLPGCERVDILRDCDEPCRYLFCEQWASSQALEDCADLLPKATFAPVMEAVCTPPKRFALSLLQSY